MKLETDVVLGQLIIIDPNGRKGDKLISMRNDPTTFNTILEAVLSPSQYERALLQDGRFTISKKRQKVLSAYMKKYPVE